jgi:hypothetical protein
MTGTRCMVDLDRALGNAASGPEMPWEDDLPTDLVHYDENANG